VKSGGGFQESAGRDWVAEVGGVDADHGVAERVEVVQVAFNNFGAEVDEVWDRWSARWTRARTLRCW
jgi:hypothetical protein